VRECAQLRESGESGTFAGEDRIRYATWSALAVLVVAALGSFVGYLILYWGYPSQESEELVAFTESGEHALWVLLVVGQVGLWFVLALALVPTFLELRKKALPVGRPIALGLIFFVVLVGLTFAGSELGEEMGESFQNPWPDHQTKLTAIAGIGAAVAAFATICMGLVHEWLARLDADTDAKTTIEGPTIAEFVRLRVILHRLLEVQATILGSAILSLAALRGAIVAVEDLTFPQELLIGYGLAGSAALVSVYGPVYSSVLGAGRRLMNKATPFPRMEADWPDAIDRRAKLETVLRIDSSVASNIQAAVAILTPLVGSVLGVIVGVE
jgi:hypothetical protein